MKKNKGKKMSTEIDVLKAKSEMLSFLTSENCTIDPDLRSGDGFSLGQQVRITVKSDSSKYGLVTLHSDYEDGEDNDDIRMRLSGRERFDETDSFDAYIDDAGVKQNYTKAQLESNDEFGEFLDETDSEHTEVVCCAPHGGMIENYTDEQAERMHSQLSGASKSSSCWRCAGWQDAIGAYDAWHITSIDVSRDSFPKLDQIGDREFTYAVSFHGYSENMISVGGGASTALKEEVAAAIEEAVDEAYEVVVVSSGPYAGTDPDNFVNWLTSGGTGGIQIEQPYGARQNYGEDIADAVAAVFAAKQ